MCAGPAEGDKAHLEVGVITLDFSHYQSTQDNMVKVQLSCSQDNTSPELTLTKVKYLTLSLSCPYLGMLYLIITPPSTAGRFGDFLN